MQLYSSRPAQRTWQIIADLMAIGAIITAVWVAGLVRDAIASLAVFGQQVEDAGTSFAGSMDEAAEWLLGVPLVGELVSPPFEDASDAADQLAAAGADGRDSILAIAEGVGLALWLLPVLVIALVWLLPRLRFALRTRATARVLAHPAGRDVLALRALSEASFADVVATVPDPLGAIRTGDAAALDALARLALRSQGVHVPAALTARERMAD